MTPMLVAAGLAAAAAAAYLVADCRPNATDRASTYDPRATEWPSLTGGQTESLRPGRE